MIVFPNSKENWIVWKTRREGGLFQKYIALWWTAQLAPLLTCMDWRKRREIKMCHHFQKVRVKAQTLKSRVKIPIVDSKSRGKIP
jgi:hypothetical protein